MSNDNFKIDFMGIGVIRGGSSWIYECLKEHPEICVSNKKETHFFNTDENYKKGLIYYKKFFAGCSNDKILGEFDPGYITSPKTLKRISETFPDIKLIISLRNPIERAYSHFLKHKGKGCNQIEKFEDIIKGDNLYLRCSLYSFQIKECFKLFNKENILILFYEDIKKNPKEFMRKIYSFLGVDESFLPKTLHTKINYLGYSTAKFKKLNKFLTSPSLFIPKTKMFNGLRKNENARKIFLKIKKFLLRANTKIDATPKQKQEMPEKTRESVYKVLGEDIKKLEELLGKKLDCWK